MLVLASTPTTASAQTPPPSVRLMAASPKVTMNDVLFRVVGAPGVFVASVGGDFELRASRPDYGRPIRLVQVDARSGATVRVLPSRLATGWRGLRRFLRVTVRSSRGRVVSSRYADFCPNGERERVSDAGPLLPRYPADCWSSFPFIRGMVWGIDAGWASSAAPSDEALEQAFEESLDRSEALELLGSSHVSQRRRPRRGRRIRRYTVTVRITSEYRKLFAVPAADARARVRVTTVARPRRRRRSRGGAAAASARMRAAQVPAVTAPAPRTLPDLVALPGHDVRLVNRRGRNVLRFAATTWNAGPGPLVIDGFRRPGTGTMDAYQYFLEESETPGTAAVPEGTPVGRSPAGTMRYHGGGHEHWHLLQFAGYSLLDASMRRVVRGRKQSFCLTPTDPVDLTVQRASWAGEATELSSACGSPASIWVREALGVGWGDTYASSLQGQSFDVTKLRNGRYHLRIQANPLGSLREGTTANNVSLRTIRLRGRGARRRVSVAPWKGIRD
jgi:hypothetical protein